MKNYEKIPKSPNKLPVIHECQELIFTPDNTPDYYVSIKSPKKMPFNAKEETNISQDINLLNRDIKEIIQDYDNNPFFRAKLNCLLKTKNSISYSSKENQNNDTTLRSFKNTKKSLNQEY